MAQYATLSLLRNSTSGKLESGYFQIPENNAFRIAAPYRLDRSVAMTAVHPLASAGANAYFRFADVYTEYSVRLCWRGGEPPFRIVKAAAPSYAKIGLNSDEQVFDRTPSAYSNIFIHSLPERYAEVNCQFPVEAEGQSHTFRYFVIDQNDQELEFNWQCTVDSSKFRYFSGTTGNDSADGSFATPWLTFDKGYTYANAQNYIYKYKAGTYSTADSSLASNRCFSHIGVEAGVNFNCDAGGLSGGLDDVTLKNIRFTGAKLDAGSVRLVNLTNRSNRAHIHKCSFNPTSIGAIGNDNPSGLMFNDLSGYHDDVSFVDCHLESTAKSQLFTPFAVRNWLYENCTSDNPTIENSNGAYISNLKDGLTQGTVRFCDFTGNCALGVLWVSNQTYLECSDVEVIYNRIVNTRPGTSGYVLRWNGQVLAGQVRPPNQYCQRNSINAGEALNAIIFESNGTGDNVNYSSILWSGAGTNIYGSSSGGTAFGTSNVKVVNVDTIAEADIGKRGWTIASTLVT